MSANVISDAGSRAVPAVIPFSVLSRDTGHEQVVFCRDQRSGLRAIIAVYSTALGPALGGTRFYPYQTEEAALADVLRLSRAMAYKNALAGLDLGGGKAVIIGDPAATKSEPLLRAFGRFVQSLGGRYITACDVGTFPEDMDQVARECRYVTGRTVEVGGAGDSSVLTAFGVLRGMQAASEQIWGSSRLYGRRVGVQGVGKVGSRLAEHLVEQGATVLVHDIDENAVFELCRRVPGIEVVASLDELVRADLDVFAPCALGGVLDEETVARLSARIVCGGANNQLANDGIGKLLEERGIWYAPDYVVNAGGVIQVADEIGGFQFDRARARVNRIYDTTKEILSRAAAGRLLPDQAANQIAEDRMAAVSALRAVHLPMAG